MRVNGTLVNYFIHCRRQWYLHYHRINMEDESELVHIGKVLHEQKANDEFAIEGIKIDKITKEYIIEIKKSNADIEAAKFQLLFYLKTAQEKGIFRKGKLECLEKNKQKKKEMIFDYQEHEEELEQVLQEMQKQFEDGTVPAVEKKPGCQKCAYYKYCFV